MKIPTSDYEIKASIHSIKSLQKDFYTIKDFEIMKVKF